jgi:hypothetical protein
MSKSHKISIQASDDDEAPLLEIRRPRESGCAAQCGCHQHTRVIVWICALMLLMNVLLLTLLGVGSMYAYSKVERLSNNLDSITNTVDRFGNAFTNVSLSVQLLPTNM